MAKIVLTICTAIQILASGFAYALVILILSEIECLILMALLLRARKQTLYKVPILDRTNAPVCVLRFGKALIHKVVVSSENMLEEKRVPKLFVELLTHTVAYVLISGGEVAITRRVFPLG